VETRGNPFLKIFLPQQLRGEFFARSASNVAALVVQKPERASFQLHKQVICAPNAFLFIAGEV